MSAPPSGGGCSCGPKAPPQFEGQAGDAPLGGGGGGGDPSGSCKCVCKFVPKPRTPTPTFAGDPVPTEIDRDRPLTSNGGALAARLSPGTSVSRFSLGAGIRALDRVPLYGPGSLLRSPQAALGGVRPLGLGLFSPAWTLGGGRQGTGVRPLSRAPAAAVVLTRRNAVPSPCTPTLENYSPSLKGARYPTSMGDGLQRSFAGCDTGKPAPGGAPPLTVSPPTATPDASRGTDWVFLGFGRAGGTRSAPPLSALPDPVHPPQGRYGRSPHGSLDGPPPVAPPHSGVKAFDFGPGGGLGSEGLDRHHDGVPDAVALEIRDRLGAYPGLLPGESPDPDLRTRQPAGALDALDLVGAGVRTPAPRPVLSPALGRGAFGALALDPGPVLAAREGTISRGTPQRSLGGRGGGGPSPAVAAVLEADVAVEQARAAFLEVDARSRFASPEEREFLGRVSEDLRREWRDAERRRFELGDPERLDRLRERARKDERIRRRAEYLVTRSQARRFDARVKRFEGLSGREHGVWRALDYGRAQDALHRARGEFRDSTREARQRLRDLRGREDRGATAVRERALREYGPSLMTAAETRVAAAERALQAARAAVEAAPTEDVPARAAEATQRMRDLSAARRERERTATLLGLGSFRDLAKSTDGAIREAEGARKKYEAAAERVKDLALGSSTEEARLLAAEALEGARRELEEAEDWKDRLLEILEQGTKPVPAGDAEPGDGEPKPADGEPAPEGETRSGPDLPGELCMERAQGGQGAKAECGSGWCPPPKADEECVECHWETSGGFASVGGGKGKGQGGQTPSLGGGERKVDPSLLQANVDTAPKANLHRLDGRGVVAPGDGPAAGVGTAAAIAPFASAQGPIPLRGSPNMSPAAGAVVIPGVNLAPQDARPTAETGIPTVSADPTSAGQLPSISGGVSSGSIDSLLLDSASPTSRPRRVISGVDYSSFGDPDAFVPAEVFERRARNSAAEVERVSRLESEAREWFARNEPWKVDISLDSSIREVLDQRLREGEESVPVGAHIADATDKATARWVRMLLLDARDLGEELRYGQATKDTSLRGLFERAEAEAFKAELIREGTGGSSEPTYWQAFYAGVAEFVTIFANVGDLGAAGVKSASVLGQISKARRAGNLTRAKALEEALEAYERARRNARKVDLDAASERLDRLMDELGTPRLETGGPEPQWIEGSQPGIGTKGGGKGSTPKGPPDGPDAPGTKTPEGTKTGVETPKPCPPCAANEAGIRADLKALEGGRTPGSTSVVASETELQALFDKWSSGGTPVPASNYKGPFVQLPDGTTVGMRPSSTSGGATIDVTFPSGKYVKVHIK